MSQIKQKDEITAYMDTKGDFSDFPKFEGKKARRQFERQAFINNIEYTPNYDYPKLDSLIDDNDLATKKHQIYEAILELEAAKQDHTYKEDELEIYASFHEHRLKKIMLVEAARGLKLSSSSSESEMNRRSFVELNEIIYGKLDTECFFGMINTEKEKLKNFNPNNQLAYNTSIWLTNEFARMKTGDEKETEILSESEISRLHDYVTTKYKDILDVVPDTPDDVYYDAAECAQIMNLALEAGGLSQFGWRAEENPAKVSPSTSGEKKLIALPSSTKRNSSELKRLIMHEQEVHARRNQNANLLDVRFMKIGTANHADAEEGLGVIMECAVAGNIDNDSFFRARDRYITAGLALGADEKPRDAREVYEILWRIFAVRNSVDGCMDDKIVRRAKNDAYSHIENAYRGTQFWMKGVIYMKLKVYYEGLKKNADYFRQNIDNLDVAFQNAMSGKYDHTDAKETETVVSTLRQKQNRVDY